MNLNDLTPEPVNFELSIPTKSEKMQLCYRAFSLADEQWVNRTYTQQELADAFLKFDSVIISKIAFKQLDLESKKKIMTLKFLDMDEDGNDIEVNLTGPNKLSAILIGVDSLRIILESLVKCRGVSSPLIEEIKQGKLKEAMESKL